MISKTKLKKLEADLKKLGVSQEEQAATAEVTRVTLVRIYADKSKNNVAISKLIALRDKKLKKAKALEAAI